MLGASEHAKFGPIAGFLTEMAESCPHHLFQSDARASQGKAKFDLDAVEIKAKRNHACRLAGLVLQTVTHNKRRHDELQRIAVRAGLPVVLQTGRVPEEAGVFISGGVARGGATSPSKSKVAEEAREASPEITRRLTPGQRLEAHLMHSELVTALHRAGHCPARAIRSRLIDVETQEELQRRIGLLESIARGERAVEEERIVSHAKAKAKKRLARRLK